MLALLLLAAIVLLVALYAVPFVKRERLAKRVARQSALLRMAPPHVLARLQMHGSAVIARLEAERQACFDFIDSLTAQVETEGRDMVPAERQNVEAQHARVVEIDAQLQPLRDFEELRGEHRAAGSQFTGTGRESDQGAGAENGRRGLGPQVTEREYEYRSVGEFLADVYKSSGVAERNPDTRHVNRDMVDASTRRLQSHGLSTEGGALHRAAAPHNTTTEVAGLIPVTIVGEVMSNIDAARPFVTSVGSKDLGSIPGTTFKRPVVTQHTQVGKQSAEKAEVANRQFTVGSVTFTKDTYGGWANVSRQSIDWTSPGVWDALMTDFEEQYALETENAAADAFVTAVTAATATVVADDTAVTLPETLKGLYAGAALAYAGSGRMPDTIWASLDMWGKLGVLIDQLKATTAGNGGGSSSLDSFAGNLLAVPRIIVPSMASGTLIVGVKSRTEVYEDRFGFLSAIEPKVFGVELAYGGYMASGTVKAGAFAKVTFAEAP